MNNSIKYITPLVFIFLFILYGMMSLCLTLSAKMVKIADIEILLFPETTESEKNAEGENETMAKELFFSNHNDYNLQKTYYTKTKKSIDDNNFARKQDFVFSVLIPPPKIV